MAARVLSISFPAFFTSLGCKLDVLTDEFNLSRTQVKKLTDTLELMTINEVRALALALGYTGFVAGPLAILVDLVPAGGLLELYTYLILAQGKINGLIGLSEVLFMQDNQNYTESLLKLRASLQHWLYSPLVFASGLFVGVDQAQSLHNPDIQLPNENAGFPMPQQLADLTLAEVEY